MKKSLIAMAVLAAAGAASAQSSVQLYGIADVWFGSLKSQEKVGGVWVGERQTGLYDGGVSNSRWGLKGSEDLGGGLKAIFTLEQGFNIDDGAAVAGFNREASIGVAGNFGTVKLGKQFNAFDDVSGAASSVFDSDLAPINTVFKSTAFAANDSNTVKYISPSFSGFTGAVSYNFGENKTATTDATNNYALSGQYVNGPLALGVGYAVNDKVAANNEKAARVNGSYDLGVATLKASYGRVAAAGTRTNEYEIGVDVPLASNMTLSAGYAYSKDKDADKRNGFGAAVAYSLSKRTLTYAGFNSTKEKDAAGDTVGKLNIFAVGVKHAF